MAGYLFNMVERLRVITANQLPYKTGLAKLFKTPIVFNQGMVAADLVAIECDFTGYVAVTETTLPAPYVDPSRGGVSFQVPTLNYATGSPLVTGNDVCGGWFETAGGVLLMAWQIDIPWPMQVIDMAMPVDLIVNMYATNQVYVSINGVPQ